MWKESDTKFWGPKLVENMYGFVAGRSMPTFFNVSDTGIGYSIGEGSEGELWNSDVDFSDFRV